MHIPRSTYNLPTVKDVITWDWTPRPILCVQQKISVIFFLIKVFILE